MRIALSAAHTPDNPAAVFDGVFNYFEKLRG